MNCSDKNVSVDECDTAGPSLTRGAHKAFAAFRASTFVAGPRVTFATYTAADRSEKSFYQFRLKKPIQKNLLSFYLTELVLTKLLSKRHGQLEVVLLPPLSCEKEGLSIVTEWMQDALYLRKDRENGLIFPTDNVLKACYIERALSALGLSADAQTFRARILAHYFNDKKLEIKDISDICNNLPYESFWVEKVVAMTLRMLMAESGGTTADKRSDLRAFIAERRSLESRIESRLIERCPQYFSRHCVRDVGIEKWALGTSNDAPAEVDGQYVEIRRVKTKYRPIPYRFQWVEGDEKFEGFFMQTGVKLEDRELFQLPMQRPTCTTRVGLEWERERRDDREELSLSSI